MTPISAASKRRRLSPEARREEILITATTLLATAGWSGVSLEGIAEAAGITKSGLLHHFPSKEILLTAVLDRRDVLDLDYVAEQGDAPAGNAAAARHMLWRLVEHNSHQRPVIQLYATLSTEALNPTHPAHAYFQERYERSVRRLSESVFSWHVDAPRVSVETLAFMDGLQLYWLRDPRINFIGLWTEFADRHITDAH